MGGDKASSQTLPSPEEVSLLLKLVEDIHPARLAQQMDRELFSDLGKTLVLGLGKAAWPHTQALMQYLPGETGSMVITKAAPGLPRGCFTGGHPISDSKSFQNGKILREFLRENPADTLVVALSGGASTVVEIAAEGLDDEQLIDWQRGLLLKGTPIEPMNRLRRSVSQLKNAGLLNFTPAKKIITCMISDIPQGDPALVGSGPTLFVSEDPEQLMALGENYLQGKLLASYRRYIQSSAYQKLHEKKRQAFASRGSRLEVMGNASTLLGAAKRLLQEAGLDYRVHPHALDMSFEEGVEFHLKRGINILSGGEIPVEVKGQGRGGRNCHFVLHMGLLLFENNALQLSEAELDKVFVASLGTDGTDGNTDAAGAWMNRRIYQRAQERGLDLRQYILDYNSFEFFSRAGGLITTGATGTNIMDVRMVKIP